MKNYCTFYIVRHGETEWNRERWVMGHSDSPLTKEGLSQAKDLDEDVVLRFMNELSNIAVSHMDKIVLISTHEGPIRLLLMKLGIVPYGSLVPGAFENAGYLVVKSDGSRFDIDEVKGLKSDIWYEKKKN